jgi:hypothetical protein
MWISITKPSGDKFLTRCERYRGQSLGPGAPGSPPNRAERAASTLASF